MERVNVGHDISDLSSRVKLVNVNSSLVSKTRIRSANDDDDSLFVNR
jgi:hypothetical protein